MKPRIRLVHPDDWEPAPIKVGKYSNPEVLTGWRRRGGRRGNPLHPACDDQDFETGLANRMQKLKDAYPGVIARRCFIQMPHSPDEALPQEEDYSFVSAPNRLVTTSVTVILAPNGPELNAELGFCFRGSALPSLRDRIRTSDFQGLVGNLGYYMTNALIEGLPWSHNARFPRFPLGKTSSYIGFHLFRDEATDEIYGSFQGAHPAAVGVRRDGIVEILPKLRFDRYEVVFRGPQVVRLELDEIDDASLAADVALFTPAFQGTPEIQQLVKAAENSAGASDGWRTCRPMLPIAAGDGRVNVFVANDGNGRMPVEKAVAVWEGESPLPSFGAVLSFERAYFDSLFTSAEHFRNEYLGTRVQIVPQDARLDAYTQILGGLVPVIVQGEHVYCQAGTPHKTMKTLSRYGATSPVARCGRESKNFDLWVREPAGVLVQTKDRIGWVLFDGRHELSIGASVVDVAAILKKLEAEGVFKGPVQQAVFVDGGSAMKAYHVRREGAGVRLDLLNRVAAGSRNGPGADPEGLNLYTLLKLCPGPASDGTLDNGNPAAEWQTG